MLKCILPYKALDERLGRTEIEFLAYAVYFYDNTNTPYKPTYIVQVPLDLRNRDWRIPPTKTDPRYDSCITKGQNNHNDAFYEIGGHKGRISFLEVQAHTPSYEEDKHHWLEHSAFNLHSHYEDIHLTKHKIIQLPFKIFNFIEVWNGKKYEIENLEHIIE